MPINIYKSFGEKNNLMLSDSLWELKLGNLDNSQSFTESPDHLDLIRLELLDSNKNKGMLFIESESEEEEEKDQLEKVSFMESQSIRELENLRSKDPTELLLKKKLEPKPQTWES